MVLFLFLTCDGVSLSRLIAGWSAPPNCIIYVVQTFSGLLLRQKFFHPHPSLIYTVMAAQRKNRHLHCKHFFLLQEGCEKDSPSAKKTHISSKRKSKRREIAVWGTVHPL